MCDDLETTLTPQTSLINIDSEALSEYFLPLASAGYSYQIETFELDPTEYPIMTKYYLPGVAYLYISVPLNKSPDFAINVVSLLLYSYFGTSTVFELNNVGFGNTSTELTFVIDTSMDSENLN